MAWGKFSLAGESQNFPSSGKSSFSSTLRGKIFPLRENPPNFPLEGKFRPKRCLGQKNSKALAGSPRTKTRNAPKCGANAFWCHMLSPGKCQNSGGPRRFWLFLGSVRGFLRRIPAKSREEFGKYFPESRNALITTIRRPPDYSSNLCPPKLFAIWLFRGCFGPFMYDNNRKEAQKTPQKSYSKCFRLMLGQSCLRALFGEPFIRT